ncbi:unnamed protein product [Prunus armeniaca]
MSYNESNATLEAHQCDKMQKTFDEIKELATDSKEKCVIVMAWMYKLKEQLSNHDNVTFVGVVNQLPSHQLVGVLTMVLMKFQIQTP